LTPPYIFSAAQQLEVLKDLPSADALYVYLKGKEGIVERRFAVERLNRKKMETELLWD